MRDARTIEIPSLALVVLIGPSGGGKSTFAGHHFLPTETVSSDACRGLVSDDPNDQSATPAAFELLHFIAAQRLKRGRLTVIDASNVQRDARRSLLELAREYNVLPVAIVFNVPERVCRERNRERPDRAFGPHVIRQQHRNMRDSLKGLRREGFRYVHVLNSIEEIDAVEIVRTRLWTDKTDEHGPFDFIGDVHGCFDELRELLEQLGYAIGEGGKHGYRVIPPAGRTAIFLGDLIDRGPNSPDVLRLVMGMVASGTAYCLPGNHDDKLLRYLQGRNVQIAHGLAETIEQLRAQPAEFSGYVLDFLDSLVSHYVLDGGKLVVAHGGMPEEYQNRSSRRVRDIALFGVTTGEEDELGLPVRIDWGADYRGQALVVYGHTPVAEPEWVNRTINIDTGCVFGGRLTALRYPECELVSVSARRAYSETARPFLAEKQDAPESEPRKYDDLLEIDDVLGRRGIETRLMGRVTVRAEQAAAALEVVSRFALDPRRLIYLPPTMSPVAATTRDGLLEHPTEAFDYFHSEGVARVMCQEKHMGSRYRDRRA